MKNTSKLKVEDIDRHACLRAAFRHRAAGEAVQIIPERVEVPWSYHGRAALTAERFVAAQRDRDPVTGGVLREYLAASLADYMAPATVTMRDALPVP